MVALTWGTPTGATPGLEHPSGEHLQDHPAGAPPPFFLNPVITLRQPARAQETRAAVASGGGGGGGGGGRVGAAQGGAGTHRRTVRPTHPQPHTHTRTGERRLGSESRQQAECGSDNGGAQHTQSRSGGGG